MNTNSNNNVNELCPVDCDGYGILPHMDTWSLQFLTIEDQNLAPIEYTYIKYHADKHKWRFMICLLICLVWIILTKIDTSEICGQSCENIHIYLCSIVHIDIGLLLFSLVLYLLPTCHSHLFQIIYLLTCVITIKYPFRYSTCFINCFINFYLFCLPFHSFKNISIILLIISIISNPIIDTILKVINSAYLAQYHHISGAQFDPYVWTIASNSLKSALCTARFIYSLMGTNKATKRMLNNTTNMYLNKTPIGLNSIQSLPSSRVYTITYSNLIENLVEQLNLICQFIGIQVTPEQLSKHNCYKKQFKPADIVQEHSQSIIQQLIERNLPTNY
ncbi:unnamed protein product [Rotaria sp. Silwood2]|nr:unnamed protein product [Rotaria sp. Silwood2]